MTTPTTPDRTVIDTATMPWINGLDVLANMAPAFRDNLGPRERVDDMFARYHRKTLRLDDDTTRRLDLIRVEPGYRDLTNAYHDSVEECLVLEGTVSIDGEGEFRAGDYFWRPPGYVHAAETADGFTALLGFQGVDPDEDSEGASRVIRPDEEAGTNALDGTTEGAFAADTVGPRGWVRCSSGLLPEIPGPVVARHRGPFEGMDLDRLSVRVLSHNPWTDGQTLLVRLLPGYTESGSAHGTAAYEHVVLEGSYEIAGEMHGTGTYLQRPAGVVDHPMTSADGALLYVKLDGTWDRVVAANTRS